MPDDREFEWSAGDWIRKLKEQADQSREYRHKLYDRVQLKTRSKILDIGCGTGAVTRDIAEMCSGEVTGVDMDPEKLDEARRYLNGCDNVTVMEGNVENLPFDDGTFDMVVFNIVLMHVKDQQRAVHEMARVTAPGGVVLATLEPDYAGRIEYPENPTGDMILKSLEKRGADIMIGRKLKVLFNTAGLKTEVGMDTETEYLMMGDEKYLEFFQKDFWVTEKLLRSNGWDDEKIERYRIEASERIEKGLAFRFLPCFWAVGRK